MFSFKGDYGKKDRLKEMNPVETNKRLIESLEKKAHRDDGGVDSALDGGSGALSRWI
jgi:hypothetical protein